MRYALPFVLVCGALLTSLAVLGSLGRAPDAVAPYPELTLRDPEGARFDVARLSGRLWVATFLDAGCVNDCPATLERLARLRDGLPEEIPQVTFLIGGRSLWPAPIEAATERRRWTICQGNSVDADGEEKLKQAALGFFGIPDEGLSGLARRDPAAWVVVIDGQNRPLEAYPMREDASADAAVAAAWGDVEFRTTLAPNPSREFRLFVAITLLLVVGVVLARLDQVKLHPFFTGGATVLSVVLLGFAFQYVEFALSTPSRGTGWVRPLYFTILATHAALCAVCLVLASTLIFHAVRRQLERHRAMARWVAPAWISVTLTGAVIYYLIGLWFPVD